MSEVKIGINKTCFLKKCLKRRLVTTLQYKNPRWLLGDRKVWQSVYIKTNIKKTPIADSFAKYIYHRYVCNKKFKIISLWIYLFFCIGIYLFKVYNKVKFMLHVI